jgi:hypothetical protein
LLGFSDDTNTIKLVDLQNADMCDSKIVVGEGIGTPPILPTKKHAGRLLCRPSSSLDGIRRSEARAAKLFAVDRPKRRRAQP